MIASKGKLNNVMDVNKGLVVQRIVSILKMPKPEDNLLLLIDPIKKILSENNQNKVIIENSLIKNFKSASEDNKLKMGFLIKINCFDENGKFNGCSSFSEKNRNEENNKSDNKNSKSKNIFFHSLYLKQYIE